MKTQTTAVLENGAAILKAAGMTPADVVQSRIYITDTAAFQDMNAAYRAFFPKDPPVRATVKAGLMGAQYVVEITMLAVKGQRQAITPANADGTPGTPNPNLSSAIRAGDRLWLSGMLGNTPATKDDVAAQTKETLARLQRAAQAAGFDWTNLKEAVVYITDMKNRAAVEKVWREAFPKGLPAGVQVESGLVAPDGLVEIMLSGAR
jgi:enamine deaminase RidA (YjgF/YER057c/UK114 family)